MPSTALLFVLAAVAACVGAAPSILFVLVDDLGSADIAYNAKILGNDKPAIATPNIDALAAESVRMKRYYTHQVCGPSRCAIVTGRTAASMGNPFPTVFGGGLDIEYKTIADDLHQRGYSTHFVGKWGIDSPLREDMDSRIVNQETINGLGSSGGKGPAERGFHTFDGLYASSHNHYTKEVHMGRGIDWHKHNRTHQLDHPHPEVDPRFNDYSTHIFKDDALKVISQWTDEKPGYLHLSFTAPHDPLQVPDKYVADGSSCGHIENWRRRVFCGMVACVDEAMGEIIQFLKDTGRYDNTIIAFTSDNGGAPSVGGFNYPFRGQKATIFEGGLRVPALLHLPKSLSKSKIQGQFDGIIHASDWTPTFLSLLDHHAGKKFSHTLGDIDGVDQTEVFFPKKGLLKKVKDKVTGGSAEDSEFVATGPRNEVVEYNVVMDHAMLIEGNWKLLLGNPGREERFNEPHNDYFDADERTRFCFEEVGCDVIEGLGTNYYQLGWSFRFFLDATLKWLYATDPRAYYTRDLVTGKEYGDKVPVTEENLPKLDWDDYQYKRIRLYDLDTDPFENNNVALDHKERVAAMTEKILQKINRNVGHNLSIQKQFSDFAMDIVNTVKKILFAFLLVLIFTIWYCCFSGPPTSTTPAPSSSKRRGKKEQ